MTVWLDWALCWSLENLLIILASTCLGHLWIHNACFSCLLRIHAGGRHQPTHCEVPSNSGQVTPGEGKEHFLLKVCGNLENIECNSTLQNLAKRRVIPPILEGKKNNKRATKDCAGIWHKVAWYAILLQRRCVHCQLWTPSKEKKTRENYCLLPPPPPNSHIHKLVPFILW
jgi:hypothetical protein